MGREELQWESPVWIYFSPLPHTPELTDLKIVN